MSTSVLVIQGAGPGAHDADRAIADELQRALGDGFRVAFPRMPGEPDPQVDVWQRAIAREARRGAADVVVAHSAGAAILADLLAQGRGPVDLPRARSAFLLAPPYIGQGGWELGGFHLDAQRADPPALGLALFLYFGEADTTVPVSHAALYGAIFPLAAFTRLAGCDHQFTGHVARLARDVEAAV